MKYENWGAAGHPGYLPEKLIRGFFGIPRSIPPPILSSPLVSLSIICYHPLQG